MKKVKILIPIYNDWESLKKLILDINDSLSNIEGFLFDCIIVNDASTLNNPLLIKPKNINSLKILNMKENKGHARCFAFGIRYITENEDFDYLILMDGDGEDRPVEIKNLIKKILEEPNKSFVARRVKRSEGTIFKFLYFMHKFITLFFTGKKIDFGNYSCLCKKDVLSISSEASLWSSYSGTVKKYIHDFGSIDSERGKRYFGPSKMSLYKLVIHSFSIIAVFKYQVLLRSIVMILILSFFKDYFGLSFIFLSIVILLFTLIIILISTREKKEELVKSKENLTNIKDITH